MMIAFIAEVGPDVLEMTGKIDRGIAGVPLLVLEADHVGQTVIAKEHACLTIVDRTHAEQCSTGLFTLCLEPGEETAVVPYTLTGGTPRHVELIE